MRIKATELTKTEEAEPSVPCFPLCQAEEQVVEETPPVKEKKWTTMKTIVWVCLLNGIAWVWCSYILAALGKEQIAESLSQVALTEIIGVVLVYAVKAIFENLSKHNTWPDKPGTDGSDGAG